MKTKKTTPSSISAETIKKLVDRGVDIYDTLGVARNYKDVDLEAAHDIKAIEERSEQRNEDVKLAYSILKNAKQRKIYEILWRKRKSKEPNIVQKIYKKIINKTKLSSLFIHSLVNGFLLFFFGFPIIGNTVSTLQHQRHSPAGDAIMFVVFLLIPVGIWLNRYSKRKLQIRTGKFVNFLLAIPAIFLSFMLFMLLFIVL